METIDEVAAHISDLVPGGISRKLLKQTLSAIFCERDKAHDRVDALANDVARLHRRITELETALDTISRTSRHSSILRLNDVPAFAQAALKGTHEA